MMAATASSGGSLRSAARRSSSSLTRRLASARKLTELAESGIVVSIDQVLEELKAADDEVLKWANRHAGIFMPLDAQIQTEGK